MFQKWLNKIRSKSDIEKRNFSLIASLIITSFIFIVWVFTFFNTNHVSEAVKEVENVSSPIQSGISALKSIGDFFKGGVEIDYDL